MVMVMLSGIVFVFVILNTFNSTSFLPNHANLCELMGIHF